MAFTGPSRRSVKGKSFCDDGGAEERSESPDLCLVLLYFILGVSRYLKPGQLLYLPAIDFPGTYCR